MTDGAHPPDASTEASVLARSGHPDRWKVLAVLCAALSVVVLDNTILAVAIPSLGADLDADETALQWVTAAYGLVLATLLLPLAGVGDRFGRKGLLMVGVAIFGVGSGGAALAATSGHLTIARGLMGIGGAATMPATLSVLSNVFAEHERGRAIAVWSGVSSMAGAAGPIVGGVLLNHFWWGSVFLVNVPFTLVVLVAVAVLVPTSRNPATPPLDVPGSLLWAGALGLLLYALIEGGGASVSPLVVGLAVLGLALLVAFAKWERHTEYPLLSPRAVADPRMQAGMVAVPVIFFSVFGAQFVLSQWLQGVQDLTPLAAGLCFVPNAAMVLIGSVASTAVVERIGLARTTMVGLLLLATTLGLAIIWHQDVAPIVVAVTLAGLGVGLALPPAIELIMGSVPAEQAGQAAGINETIIEAGGAFGIAVMGSALTLAAGGIGSVSPDALGGPGGLQAQMSFTDALWAPILVAVVLLLGAMLFVHRRTRGTVAASPGDPVGETVAVSATGVVIPGPVPSGSEDRPVSSDSDTESTNRDPASGNR